MGQKTLSLTRVPVRARGMAPWGGDIGEKTEVKFKMIGM